MGNIFYYKPNTIHSLDDILKTLPINQTIGDNFIKAWSIINSPLYKKICCSVSGGSDSDIVVDICVRCDINHKITYVYFDTGLEFEAAKEHIKYLEQRYKIKILTYKAYEYGMSVPASCMKYGQPFINKKVSEYIHRLQLHDFKWEDKPFDDLYKEYPNCYSALEWWCNMKKSNANNICNNKWLKEFLIKNKPTFQISNKCCDKAKKDIIHRVLKDGEFDLSIVGIRKAEGGVRATAYKNCYSKDGTDIDTYRPVFWYQNDDKTCYENHYGILHSRCYTEYGMKRTGCCGCPYGRNIDFELDVLKEHEPNLYKAVCNIFKDSYEFTKQYKKFYEEMNRKEINNENQMSIFDFI